MLADQHVNLSAFVSTFSGSLPSTDPNVVHAETFSGCTKVVPPEGRARAPRTMHVPTTGARRGS
jgi:hypothetical protein